MPSPAEREDEKPVEGAEIPQETIAPNVDAADATSAVDVSDATDAKPFVTESEVKGEDAE